MSSPRPKETARFMNPCRVRWWWLLFCAVSIFVGGDLASGANSAARIGSPAPDFTLRLFNGESISLSSLKGKPVLLNFWSST